MATPTPPDFPPRPATLPKAVCAERWKQANERLGRIEVLLAAIVPLCVVGEGSIIAVLQRMLGG
jgi:hypothetical protein